MSELSWRLIRVKFLHLIDITLRQTYVIKHTQAEEFRTKNF